VRNSHRFARLGALSYFASVFYTIVTYRSLPLKVWADGELLCERCFLTAVGTSRFYGGGMMVLPEASLSDGLLAYCQVDPIHIFRLVQLLGKYMKGRHAGLSVLRMAKARRIEVTSEQPFALNVDGEVSDGHTSVVFQTLPGRLKLLIP